MKTQNITELKNHKNNADKIKHRSPTVLLRQRWVLPIRGMRPHWVRKKRRKNREIHAWLVNIAVK
jgi:hypothetical protein